MKFSKDFTFGASISALQTEGKGITNRGLTTFDKYFQDHPEKFWQNMGPDKTIDITRHYKEDLKMLSDLHLESIRTGFSWVRLFPDGKKLDQEAVKYYNDFLLEMKKNKIKAYMTLFHFDMPLWAHEKGGWGSNEVIESFNNYAKFVFKEYGDLVERFVTFNEPLVPICGGYLGDGHYPGIFDIKEAVEQFCGLVIAHSKVVDSFRKLNLENSTIGVVFDWNITIAKDKSENNLLAAKVHDTFINRGPLKMLARGEIDDFLIDILKKENILPSISFENLELIKKVKVDFLGINYYFPKRVQFIENGSENIFLKVQPYLPPNARMNKHRGWEIYPESLHIIGQYIRDEFDNIPWYIAENGMGFEDTELDRDENGVLIDDFRIEYINEHLMHLKKGIDEGSNCFGYHLWSAIDCWSFRNGFKNRYGLIGVNIKTDERYFKKSSLWYKEMIDKKNEQN